MDLIYFFDTLKQHKNITGLRIPISNFYVNLLIREVIGTYDSLETVILKIDDDDSIYEDTSKIIEELKESNLTSLEIILPSFAIYKINRRDFFQALESLIIINCNLLNVKLTGKIYELTLIEEINTRIKNIKDLIMSRQQQYRFRRSKVAC